MFDQFFQDGILFKSLTFFLFAFISEVGSPSELQYFRPIFILGSLYKLMAKMLASRLTRVMWKLISLDKSTFIKERQLEDGVVALNAVVDLVWCLILSLFYLKWILSRLVIILVYLSQVICCANLVLMIIAGLGFILVSFGVAFQSWCMGAILRRLISKKV